jgi:hypothetical protein
VYRRNRRGLPAGACFDRTLQVIRLSGCTWVYSGNRQGQRLFRTHINKPRRSGGRSLYRSMLLWPGVEHRRPKHVRGPALCTRGRLLGQSPPSLAQCPVARCCQSQHYSTFATALPRSTDTCGAHCGAHRPQLFRTFLQAEAAGQQAIHCRQTTPLELRCPLVAGASFMAPSRCTVGPTATVAPPRTCQFM